MKFSTFKKLLKVLGSLGLTIITGLTWVFFMKLGKYINVPQIELLLQITSGGVFAIVTGITLYTTMPKKAQS